MRRLIIAAVLLLLAPVALAQVYKWTDAHGTVHYSQTPPAQGVRYSQITTTGSEHAATAQPIASKPESSTAEPARASSAPVADNPENRAALCASLKSNLALLNGSAPVVKQVGGAPKALDDTERKQEIATSNAQYAQYCSGK
jgi:hypothetical protein